ncbi:unnamed protein product, partial [marine sediment metagenome]
PGTQEDKDYNFQLYTDKLEYRSYVTTDSYQAADSNRQEWGTIAFNLDETGGRRMVLDKLEYNLSVDDSTWDGYVEIENGAFLGLDCVSKPYIKFKGSFKRPIGASAALMDSFTLVSIRITYTTQDFAETLIGSVIYKDNYIFSCSEKGTAAVVGDCLFFTGTDANNCDYVEIADSASLDPGTSDFAFVFDIKCDNDDQISSPYVFIINKQSQYGTNNTKGIWGLSWAKGSAAGTLYVELG